MLKFSNLKENFEYPESKRVEYKDQEIVIKQYLPSYDKYDLIIGILTVLDLTTMTYNPLMAELLFDYEVIKKYSNLQFDTEDERDFFKTYDILQNIGMIDLIIDSIPVVEYEEVKRLYYESVQYEIDRYSNIAMTVNDMLVKIPTFFDNALTTLETKDIDLLSETVKKVAKLKEEDYI